MRWLPAIILILLSSFGSFAQQRVAYDSSAIQARNFNDTAIGQYKKDKQFQYDASGEPVESLWSRFWKWFWSKVEDVMKTRSGRNTVYTIFIILGIAAVVFFIWKMMGDKTGLFGSSGKKGLNYEIGEEDIHSISFEDAIREAVEKENYRLAVRLVYLHSLKLLSDKALIDWKAGKTNSAYIYELKDHPAYYSFNHLTMQFEYAWYGGETVSKEHYREFEDSFREFKTQIGQ